MLEEDAMATSKEPEPLTNDDPAKLHEVGFCIVAGLLTPEVCDMLVAINPPRKKTQISNGEEFEVPPHLAEKVKKQVQSSPQVKALAGKNPRVSDMKMLLSKPDMPPQIPHRDGNTNDVLVLIVNLRDGDKRTEIAPYNKDDDLTRLFDPDTLASTPAISISTSMSLFYQLTAVFWC